MIHHISISVENPLRVASVLAEIMNGKAYRFPPSPGSYIAMPFDNYGTAIALLPLEVVLAPGNTQSQPDVQFVQTERQPLLTSVHAAISVPTSQAQIEKIGEREGWQTTLCNHGGFHVVEFWVENRLLLEFLPPELVDEYLGFAQSKAAEEFLGEPVFAMILA